MNMHDKTTAIMLIIYVFILFAVILWCLTQSELSILKILLAVVFILLLAFVLFLYFFGKRIKVNKILERFGLSNEAELSLMLVDYEELISGRLFPSQPE